MENGNSKKGAKGADIAPKAQKEMAKGNDTAPAVDETKETKLKAKKPSYVVKIAFKDAPQYRKEGKPAEYMEGSDVSDLDPERLESLVKRGIVEKKD